MSKRTSSSSSGAVAAAAAVVRPGKRPRAHKEVKESKVLEACIEGIRSRPARKTIAELGITDVFEVKELSDEAVKYAVERIMLAMAMGIVDMGKDLCYEFPARGQANQRYIKEADRLVLGNRMQTRVFSDLSQVRKTTIMTRVLELIHEAVSRNIHVTKRDLFYTDVKLFVDQKASDNVLDDLACLVGCTRTSLNIVASAKGIVVGCVRFKEDGDEIDCTKMGIGGKSITPLTSRITDISGTARFILIVEKEAAFMRLAEDRFYQQYPCVIITGKGQPDLGTRQFAAKVEAALKVPVFALVDCDPYGIKIMSVYASSSKSMSYDSQHLTCTDIKWLGLLPSDLEKYNIPDDCRLKLLDKDKDVIKSMKKDGMFEGRPAWLKEAELMLKLGIKAEIEAVNAFGFQYLTQEFLPKKLREGGWC
eukprot:UC1_evm5s1960